MQAQALQLLETFLQDVNTLIESAPLPTIPKYVVMGSIAGIEEIITKYLPAQVDAQPQANNAPQN